jgi:diadenosine tetraphosphate (Ap4A) HIT family hydrolase
VTPDERLEQLARGENPQMIARMESGFAVMADFQFLPGYCLLLAYPKVGQLNDLTGEDRAGFLRDMARLGDAVKELTGAVRINYSIYGNLDPFLHAHVFPRFSNEPDEFRTVPPFLYPTAIREAERFRFSAAEHGRLRDQIRALLSK